MFRFVIFLRREYPGNLTVTDLSEVFLWFSKKSWVCCDLATSRFNWFTAAYFHGPGCPKGLAIDRVKLHGQL